MNKDQFNNLDFMEKIEYLNNELKKGKTVIIREDIGIGEKPLKREIKANGYRYNNKEKQYIHNTEATTNYLIINLVEDKHLNPKPKSIRINEFVYQDWQQFCDEKHYNKQDLISMALKEYIEKYK